MEGSYFQKRVRFVPHAVFYHGQDDCQPNGLISSSTGIKRWLPFGRCYWPQAGWAYLGTAPSKMGVIRICEAISTETGRNKRLEQETVIGTLTRMIVGWANHFCLALVGKAYRRWNDTPGKGYDSGCVPSTKCAGRPRTNFPKPTYTTCSVQ
jgi:Group II intron, maturase-specific domain